MPPVGCISLSSRCPINTHQYPPSAAAAPCGRRGRSEIEFLGSDVVAGPPGSVPGASPSCGARTVFRPGGAAPVWHGGQGRPLCARQRAWLDQHLGIPPSAAGPPRGVGWSTERTAVCGSRRRAATPPPGGGVCALGRGLGSAASPPGCHSGYFKRTI